MRVSCMHTAHTPALYITGPGAGIYLSMSQSRRVRPYYYLRYEAGYTDGPRTSHGMYGALYYYICILYIIYYILYIIYYIYYILYHYYMGHCLDWIIVWGIILLYMYICILYIIYYILYIIYIIYYIIIIWGIALIGRRRGGGARSVWSLNVPPCVRTCVPPRADRSLNAERGSHHSILSRIWICFLS
jgi:hypothetical protein